MFLKKIQQGRKCFQVVLQIYQWKKMNFVICNLFETMENDAQKSWLYLKVKVSLIFVMFVNLSVENLLRKFLFLNRSTMIWWVICHACPVWCTRGGTWEVTLFFSVKPTVCCYFFPWKHQRDFHNLVKSFWSLI